MWAIPAANPWYPTTISRSVNLQHQQHDQPGAAIMQAVFTTFGMQGTRHAAQELSWEVAQHASVYKWQGFQQVIMRHVMSCHVMSCHVMSCHVMYIQDQYASHKNCLKVAKQS